MHPHSTNLPFNSRIISPARLVNRDPIEPTTDNRQPTWHSSTMPFNRTIYTLEHYYLAQGTMLHIHHQTTLVLKYRGIDIPVKWPIQPACHWTDIPLDQPWHWTDQPPCHSTNMPLDRHTGL